MHPYIRRRNGDEPITFLHPLLKNSLAKTLGIPLFQEQLMQITIDVAGFTPAEADQLRQAMASKRSVKRMAALSQRFLDGAGERGVTLDIAEQIWDKLSAFASYGFPESHSVSFAYIVYASAWLKYHYPSAFCAGLLDAQPMGFYSQHSLIQDVRRRDLAVMNREGIVNPDSNYCFGEGGAGTYSDGKLYTRSSKRGDIGRILSLFVHFGAEEKILYEAHPHIGTNKLPHIISAMRRQIIASGGLIYFEKKLTGFILEKNKIRSVITADGDQFNGDALILATGHSARDIFELLHQQLYFGKRWGWWAIYL